MHVHSLVQLSHVSLVSPLLQEKQKPTLELYSPLEERPEARLLLSLVSKGPYFRLETLKLSVAVGKGLQSSVFTDEWSVWIRQLFYLATEQDRSLQ